MSERIPRQENETPLATPSPDDIMELGLGLSMGKTDGEMKDLEMRIAQQILDSQNHDRGGQSENLVAADATAKFAGKDIILSIKCQGREQAVECKLPYGK